MRKSRFVAYAARTQSLEARTHLLNELRSQYADASHVCHASRIGPPTNGQLLSDDDGEPTGTAGRPILNVIEHSRVGDITIAVVRYFGGIKLGAGGLVRAYSAAASGVMQHLPLNKHIALLEIEITCDFSLENQIRNLIENSGGLNVTPHYHEQLKLTLALPASALDDTQTALNNLTRGKAVLVVRE